MKRVLVVFPTHWDERHLGPGSPLRERYEIVLATPSDADCPDDFDVCGFVDATVDAERGRLDGVTSSSDYPGATVAGAIATALGLPGSHPDTVMRASHKYYSRIAQAEAAPEATPRFALVDPRHPDGGPPALTPPFFLKPVKGAFSVLARRIESAAELRAYLARPEVDEFFRYYMRIFDRLVARYGRFEHGGGWLLAEELLKGDLVTVEGFATPAGVEILGIVDSAVHPETKSFVRFDYPSALPADVQRRMEDIARRIVARLGLVHSLFNIEMVHDSGTGEIAVIEVNPRMCGQFADLYEKVDGTSGYEVALALATGERPRVERGAGRCGAAASVPLRAFGPVRVASAPDAERVAAVERAFPGTLVWNECAAGQDLRDLGTCEDGFSVRYGVVNAGAADRPALDARLSEVRERLGWSLAPLDR